MEPPGGESTENKVQAWYATVHAGSLMPPVPFILEAWRPWLLYLPFALVALARTLVLLLLLWLALHCLAVFLGRGPKVQATPLQETSENAPPVSLSCSSRSSGVFLRWFCRLPPVSLACSSSLVCSSCVSPVSSSRAWVSGKKVAEGGPTQSPESSDESFPRALKSFQNRSQNGSPEARKSLQNGSRRVPGGQPRAEAHF